MVCCVVDCPNKLKVSSRCRSYAFPGIHFKSGKLVELSKKRRIAWIRSLRIASPNDKLLIHQRVCYLHFISGRPAKLSDENHTDWVPNQNLGVGVNRVCESALKRKLNLSRKHVKVHQSISNVEESLEISESESFAGDGNDYDEPNTEFVPVTSAPEVHSVTLNTSAENSYNPGVKTVMLNNSATSPSSGSELAAERIITDNNKWFRNETKPLAHILDRNSKPSDLSIEKLKIEIKNKEEIIKLYEKKEKEAEVKYRKAINSYEAKVKEYDLEIKKLKVKLRLHDVSFNGLKNDDEKVKNLTGLANFGLVNKLYDVVKNDLNENPKAKIKAFDSFIITLMKLRLDLPISFLSYIFGVSPLTLSRIYRENLATMNAKIGPLVKWPDDAALLLSTPSCFKEIMGDKCIVLIHFLEIFIKNLKPPIKGIQSMKHKLKYLIAFTTTGEIIYVSQGFGSSASNENIIEESGFFDQISEEHIVLSVKDMFDENQKDNGQIQRIKHMAKNTEDKVLDILKDNFRILFNRQSVNSNGEVYSEYTVRCCCALANLQMPELLIFDAKEIAETVVVHTKKAAKRKTIAFETQEQEDEIL